MFFSSWVSGPMTSSGMQVHQFTSQAAYCYAACLQALRISRLMIFAWEGRWMRLNQLL